MKYFRPVWKPCLVALLLGVTGCGGGHKNTDFTPQTTDKVAPVDNFRPVAPTQPTAARQNISPFRVALLLPITGPATELGKSLMDASLLALQDKITTSPANLTQRIVLIPKDTGGTVNGAILATQEAIREEADLILGPVFSKSLRAILPIVSPSGGEPIIPVISFSNDHTISNSGIYLMGISPDQQVKEIVIYASQNGANRFAAFLPNDLYGMTVAAAFEQQVQKLGKQLDRIIYYQAGTNPSDKELAKLVNRTQTADGEVIVQPNFDALLLPQGGAQLQSVTEALARIGVTSDTAMFLGSGQWDDPSTLAIKAVEGGIFATAMPATGHTFEKHFQQYYGYTPQRLASLAYDATALAIALSSTNPNGRISSADLMVSTGFSGPADGIFRFTSKGTAERGLAIMKVSAYDFQLLEAAPMAF